MEAKPVKAFMIGEYVVYRQVSPEGTKSVVILNGRDPLGEPLRLITLEGIRGKLGELEGEQAVFGAILKSGIFDD